MASSLSSVMGQTSWLDGGPTFVRGSVNSNDTWPPLPPPPIAIVGQGFSLGPSKLCHMDVASPGTAYTGGACWRCGSIPESLHGAAEGIGTEACEVREAFPTTVVVRDVRRSSGWRALVARCTRDWWFGIAVRLVDSSVRRTTTSSARTWRARRWLDGIHSLDGLEPLELCCFLVAVGALVIVPRQANKGYCFINVTLRVVHEAMRA